jgi:hypothetical protein
MEQFKVGDLIKLKRDHRRGDAALLGAPKALAIVLSLPLSELFSRMKIQYFDKPQPFMTDPLLWKIVSKASKMQKKC